MKCCGEGYESYVMDEETKSRLENERRFNEEQEKLKEEVVEKLNERPKLIKKTYNDYNSWKRLSVIALFGAIGLCYITFKSYNVDNTLNPLFIFIIILFLGMSVVTYYFSRVTYAEYMSYKNASLKPKRPDEI
jgi:hypothetical protein